MRVTSRPLFAICELHKLVTVAGPLDSGGPNRRKVSTINGPKYLSSGFFVTSDEQKTHAVLGSLAEFFSHTIILRTQDHLAGKQAVLANATLRLRLYVPCFKYSRWRWFSSMSVIFEPDEDVGNPVVDVPFVKYSLRGLFSCMSFVLSRMKTVYALNYYIVGLWAKGNVRPLVISDFA